MSATNQDKDKDADLHPAVVRALDALRDVLSSSNTETLARARQMMEAGGAGEPQRESAEEVWRRLRDDRAAALQFDYGLLRAGLGGRSQRDGKPAPDTNLQVRFVDGRLEVEGAPMLNSPVGLAFRQRDRNGNVVDLVVDLCERDEGDDDEWDGGQYRIGRGHPSSPLPAAEAGNGAAEPSGPITVVSFDRQAITGAGVLPVESRAAARHQ